tara:strand:- start:463 stop:1014 length:552 start_codon:yes stop_codon:yes gene_type:complete
MPSTISGAKIVTDEIENSSGANPYNITLGTSVATTSGTAVEYLSIPSGTSKITIIGQDVSTNGANEIRTQLGTSGGLVTSGYDSIVVGLPNSSSCATNSQTNALAITQGIGAGEHRNFHQTICLLDAGLDVWVATVVGSRKQGENECFSGGGWVDLSGDLTQLKIFMDGTDTFDSGRINIQFE